MTKLTAIQASAVEPVVPQNAYVHMVVDMQRGYVATLSDEIQNTLPTKIENFIAQTSSYMRTINVGVEDEEMFNFGSEESKNWDCILKLSDGKPLPIDHYKGGNSAFKFQTKYNICEATPKGLLATGANHILLTGINKSLCVADTALDAIARGYRVTIIEDLVADAKRVPSDITPGIQKCIDAGVVFETSQSFLERLMALQPKQSNHQVLKPD